MSMSLTFHRPFIAGSAWYSRINYRWFVVRLPQIVLGVETSFGVGGFIHQSGRTPLITIGPLAFDPVATIGSIAFDIIFIAMIALGDQQLTDDKVSDRWYLALNIGAAIIAGLFGTLFYAGGTYAAITLEAATHGAIFPVFGLLYSLYYHRQMKPIILREAAQALEAAERNQRAEREREAAERANPFQCEFCNERYPSKKARAGHMAQCKARPKPSAPQSS
jgi:hypothetical protein